MLIILCTSFFVGGPVLPPVWLARCAVIRPPFVPGRSVDISAQVHYIARELSRLDVEKDLIFMPESALPFALNKYPIAYAALHSLSVGRMLFLGTNRYRNAVFNAALCLNDGVEQLWHEKTHGMPGIERLPHFMEWGTVMRGLRPLLGDGFFAQAECRPDGPVDGCVVCDGIFFVPLICSEFFYRYLPHCQKSESIIVALVNDAWFAHTIIPYLLWSVARLKSVVWQQRVLYISYYYGGLFERMGEWFLL